MIFPSGFLWLMKLLIRILLLLISAVLIQKNAEAQCINPWDQKIYAAEYGSVNYKIGVYNGYTAHFGFLAHKKTQDLYAAIPYLYLPDYNPQSNKIIVVTNGGPGNSNLLIPDFNDSVLKHYSILMIGYRGIDDQCASETLSQPYHDNDLIKNSSNDFLQIIQYYSPDTLIVVSHSYGSVMANTIIYSLKNKMFVFGIFVSPLLTLDLSEIAHSLEQTIQKSLSRSDKGIFVLETLKSTLLNSEKEKLALGLLYFLSRYNNLSQIPADINESALKEILLKQYNYYESKVCKSARKLALSEIITKSIPAHEDEFGFLGQLFYNYLNSLISGNQLKGVYKPNSDTINLVIMAEEDFFTYSPSIIISKTAHADIWELVWKQLPKYLPN